MPPEEQVTVKKLCAVVISCLRSHGKNAEVVKQIDGRAFGRHSLPGLRRLGPEMMVPPMWRDWLEQRLAGLGPP